MSPTQTKSTPQRTGRVTKKAAPAARRAATPSQKARAQRIYHALLNEYADAHCELNYSSPHELLIATILSAQATDVGVNKATPALFEAFPSPADYARATPQQIEPYVKSLGFFRQKAKSIHAAMSAIVERFNGQVPQTMEELLTLRGVARKTANVVLGNAFSRSEGVVVDTHVIRLANRFKLTRHSDPAKIERDLMSLFTPDQWTMLSHLLIFHGRRACKARGGTCDTNTICREFCSNSRASAKARRASARRSAAK
jgi:endonuclease-3